MEIGAALIGPVVRRFLLRNILDRGMVLPRVRWTPVAELMTRHALLGDVLRNQILN